MKKLVAIMVVFGFLVSTITINAGSQINEILEFKEAKIVYKNGYASVVANMSYTHVADYALRNGDYFAINSIESKEMELKIHDNYSMHPPIYIKGNGNFTQENGVVSGNGTKENPYIIEGWEINASTADGIKIENTTAYFIVKNCYIYGGFKRFKYYHLGVFFLNVKNGKVENSILNEDSILIENSNYCAFSDNNFTFGITLFKSDKCNILSNINGYIALIYSEDVLVSDNILGKNAIDIMISNSKNCIIANNIISHNDGIRLYYSRSCTIINNTMIDSGIIMSGKSLENWNTHKIELNTVNGKPLLYYKNENDIVINGIEAGQIILANCSNFEIRNENISNTTVGIQIGYSRNCSIEKSRINGNREGIEIYYAENCSISNNTLAKNQKISLYLSYSIHLYHSKNINISSNIINNNEYGIYLWQSNATITKNIIDGDFDGIHISSGSCYIADNTIGHNFVGISLAAKNCTIINNTMIDNGIIIGGNSLKNWNTHKIESNTVNGKPLYYLKNVRGGEIPSGAGEIILANCSNFEIRNENISNTTVGIQIGFSKNCSIANSRINENIMGVGIRNAENIIIHKTIFNGNNEGISFIHSKECKVIGSAIISCGIGIYAEDTNSFNISDCNFSNNFEGMRIYSSPNSYIEYNRFFSNYEGLKIEWTFNSTIIKNGFYQNEKGVRILHANFINISQNKYLNNSIAISTYGTYSSSLYKNDILLNEYGVIMELSRYNEINYNKIVENRIGISMGNTSNNEIKYNDIFQNSKYGIKGKNCSDNATYNYWGSRLGPSFLFKKPFKGDAFFVYPGRIKIWPWLRHPVDSDKIKIFKFIKFDNGVYIFERKVLPKIFLHEKKMRLFHILHVVK